jgi:anti-sigma B factor antagonist
VKEISMTSAKATMNVRQVNEQVSIIDIQGEVTASAEEELMLAYDRASTENTCVLVLNFEGLDYMNSSGIGLIVTLLIRSQRQQQRLIAFGLSDHYQHIFELTRLNEAINMYPNEQEALAAARD